MKKIINNRIFFILLFCIIGTIMLMFFFPLLHDDLLHGAVGLGFNFMPHVNGRYLGNFFGINLAASLILRVFIKSFVVFLIVFLIKKILNFKNRELLLVIFLFLFMPLDMFKETVPFTAGFANYIIPILGILFIIYIHFKKNVSPSRLLIIPLLLLGIFNSLFVEHITIYNLLLSIYLIIYSLIKTKKINVVYLSYFIGSLAGTILMFTNPSYLTAISGEDTYRTISGLKEILQKPWAILRAAFFHNNAVNFTMIFLLLVLYKKCMKTKRLLTKLSKGSICLFGIYCLIKIFVTNWPVLDNFMKPFEALITLGFFLCSAYLIYLSKILKGKVLYRIAFYSVSIILLLAPLIVVNPLGPRCYTITYALMILLVADLFKTFNEKQILTFEVFEKLLILGITVQFGFYFIVYGTVYNENLDRIQSINYQLNNKSKSINIKSLPYSNYLHMSDVCSEYSELVLREYYKIPYEIPIRAECD